MPPFADIQSVIDYNDGANTIYTEGKSYPLHLETSTRKVSFSKQVAIYDIEKASDYSKSERKATWYSVRELKTLKEKAKDEVWRWTNGELDADDDSWSSRGLEGKTPEGSEQKLQSRTSAWAAVLLEQDQQDIKGVEDHEFLAEVYKEYTTVSRCLAVLKGKQDAHAAKN